jgi:hypothetical protein
MRRSVPKAACALVAALIATAAASPARAYHLPTYRMSQEERRVPAEETLAKYQARLDEVSKAVPLGVADTRRRNYKTKVSPRAKKLMKGYEDLRNAYKFWGYVVALKKDLIALHGGSAQPTAAVEADAMAKAVIQRIYDLSIEYDVAFSALVHNTLINLGIKKKGFCYHYVSDVRNTLKKYSWRHYDLHWGEAWGQRYFENNALVVTARGKAFETGIAIDAWRAAGQPFWTPVEGDRYPWKELFNVDTDYVVE